MEEKEEDKKNTNSSRETEMKIKKGINKEYPIKEYEQE